MTPPILIQQLDERKDFIRKAALRLVVAMTTNIEIGISKAECKAAWFAAETLWDNKPEDC